MKPKNSKTEKDETTKRNKEAEKQVKIDCVKREEIMAKRAGLGRGLGAFFGEDYDTVPTRKADHTVAGQTEAGTERKTEKSLKDLDMVLPSGKKAQKKAEAGKKEGRNTEKRVSEKETTSEIIKTIEVEKEKFVKLSLIEPNESQPRKTFEEEGMKELAESIRNYGVLQPLLVQKKGDIFELIAGERRFRAAKLAGLTEVPVLVREYSRQQTMEIALIENVQRADLNPIEEARAYQMLIQEFGLKQEEVAERVSKNRATVTNSMRLLKLDERVQEMLIQNKISGGHARALLALESPDQQYQTALKIVNNHLSVREAEKLVKLLSTPKKKKEPDEEEQKLDIFYHDLEEKLKTVMGTKVTINKKDKNKGRIEIEYYSSAELDRIVEMLESIEE